MAGSVTGGKRASKTNKERYGEDFYKRIGRMGGKKGTTGGFASKKVGKDGMDGRQRARVVGQRGGRISRKTPTKRSW